MNALLENAAGTMNGLFPTLPWSIRLSYDGQSTSFGNGAERSAIEFKTAEPLRCLARGDIPSFLDHYVVGDAELHGDIYGIVGVRRFVKELRNWKIDFLGRARYAWTTVFPSDVRRKLVAVSSHYDLPNGFIESYLDKKTKAYSCAMWRDPMNVAQPDDETLEDAQHNKFVMAADELQLQPDDKFLDIGCGYGYMVHLAEAKYGVKKALGITLSKNQVDNGYTKSLALKHYLEVPADGSWTKVYTCGMISHLDRSEIRRYYRHMHGMMKKGGKAWVHAIIPMANDSGLNNYTTISGTFSQRYVFPDHYQFPIHHHLQVMEEMGFLVRKVHFRYGHYGKTLRHWYRRYLAALPETRSMINPTIERAWHLYLTFASEIDGHMSVLKQIVIEKA